MATVLHVIHEINSLAATIKQWRNDHSSLVFNGSFFEPSPTQIASSSDQNNVFLIRQLSSLLDDLYMRFAESKSIDSELLFKPLIDIIESDTMSTFVKGATIGTVHRLLSLNALDYSSPNFPGVISMIVDAVISCRFEQTDSGDDEIAVMWILEAILSCFKTEMTNETKTWEMFDVAFGVCTDIHHADMLRSFAFRTVSQIVKFIFMRIFSSRLHPQNHSHSSRTGASDKSEKNRYDLSRNLGIKIFRFLCIHAEPENVEGISSPLALDSRRVSFDLINVIFETCTVFSPNGGVDFLLLHDKIFFELIQDDLLRILLQTCQTVGRRTTSVSIPLNPSSADKSSQGIGLPLRLPSPFAPTQGNSSSSFLRPKRNSYINLRLEELRHQDVSDSGDAKEADDANKKALAVGSRKSQSSNQGRTPIVVLASALRLVQLLFSIGVIRQKLKVQMEAFFNSVFLRVLEGKCSHPEEAEIVLETLCTLLSSPSLIIDIYVGFDCDPDCSNVFENIMKSLSRLAFPYRLRSPSLETQKIIALKSMLHCIRFISERCDTSINASGLFLSPSFSSILSPSDNDDPSTLVISTASSSSASKSKDTTVDILKKYLTSDALLKRKEYKVKLLHCVELFNKSPKKAAVAFAEIGLISTAEWITKKQSLDAAKKASSSTPAPPPPKPASAPTPPLDESNLKDPANADANKSGSLNEPIIKSDIQLSEPASSSQDLVADSSTNSESDVTSLKNQSATPMSSTHSDETVKETQSKQEVVDPKAIMELKDAEALARLFRTCVELDREAIGQFLGENYKFNNLVLHCFVKTFDLHGRTLVEALRMFLESFRLPKEAQQIDRILQAFADIAHAECIDSYLFATTDCTYIFTFAIIMLNTDLHNPNIKPEKKMSLDSFIRNNTNYGMETSMGKDLPREFLESVYNEIKTCEINTMVEGGQLTFEVSIDRWHDMMHRVHSDTVASTLIVHDDLILTKPEILSSSSSFSGSQDITQQVYAGSYDKMIFSLIWKLVLASTSVVFDSSNPLPPQQQKSLAKDESLQMSLGGYYMLGKIAAHFELNDIFDTVLVSICKSTTLLLYGTGAYSSGSSGTSSNSGKSNQNRKREHRFVNVGGPSAMGVRSASVHAGSTTPSSTVHHPLHFAENHKAQEATMCVFSLAKKYGDHIRRSWRHVLYCLLRLCDLKLLPNELVLESTDDLTNVVSRIRFHRQIARACIGTFEVNRARKSTEDVSTSSPVGWLPGWLFGGSDTPVNTSLDEEQISILSALRVSESSLLHFLSQTEQKTFASESVISGNTQLSLQSQEIERKTSGKGDSSSSASGNQSVQHISPQLLQQVRDYIASCHLGELVQDSKHLSDESLADFVKALVLTSGGSFQSQQGDDNKSNPGEDSTESANIGNHPEVTLQEQQQQSNAEGESGSNSEKPRGDDLDVLRLAPPTSASKVFCLHLLTEVMLRNRDRIQKLWPIIRDHYFGLIENATAPSFEIEKACVGILRICSRCLYREDMAKDCMDSIRRLLHTPQAVAPGLGNILGALIVDIVRSGKAFASSESLDPVTGWSDFFSLLDECANRQDSIEYGFEALRMTVLGPCTKANIPIPDIAESIVYYLDAEWPAESSKERMLSVLELLYTLHTRLEPEFKAYLESVSGQDLYERVPFDRVDDWIFVLKEFAQHAQSIDNQHRSSVRDQAIHFLQRAILDIHGNALSCNNWEHIFETILFPLANFSLQLTDEDCGRTMILTMTLLTKIILAYGATTLVRLPDDKFESIWIQILNLLGQYHSKDRKFGPISIVPPSLRGISETVSEHLKNLLLVLVQSNVLIPPTNTNATASSDVDSATASSSTDAEGSTTINSNNKSNIDGKRLWDVTWLAVEPFMPGLKSELFG